MSLIEFCHKACFPLDGKDAVSFGEGLDSQAVYSAAVSANIEHLSGIIACRKSSNSLRAPQETTLGVSAPPQPADVATVVTQAALR